LLNIQSFPIAPQSSAKAFQIFMQICPQIKSLSLPFAVEISQNSNPQIPEKPQTTAKMHLTFEIHPQTNLANIATENPKHTHNIR
jgi:hypothetical protein